MIVGLDDDLLGKGELNTDDAQKAQTVLAWLEAQKRALDAYADIMKEKSTEPSNRSNMFIDFCGNGMLIIIRL